MKMVEFADSVDSDEASYNEPPHLDLLFTVCNIVLNSHCDTAWTKHVFFFKTLQK